MRAWAEKELLPAFEQLRFRSARGDGIDASVGIISALTLPARLRCLLMRDLAGVLARWSDLVRRVGDASELVPWPARTD